MSGGPADFEWNVSKALPSADRRVLYGLARRLKNRGAHDIAEAGRHATLSEDRARDVLNYFQRFERGGTIAPHALVDERFPEERIAYAIWLTVNRDDSKENVDE